MAVNLPPELWLEGDAARLLLKWRGRGVDRVITADYEHGGVRCRIILEPVGIPVLDPYALTDCQSDILDVLRAAGKRLKQFEVIDALCEAKKQHGDSTVLRTLTAMKKSGRLTHVARRGYGIPAQHATER